MESHLEAVTKIVDMCNHTLQRVDNIERASRTLRNKIGRHEGVAVLNRIDESVDDIRIAQLSIKALF